MGDETGIEWTDSTWNPVRGCSRVSEGCRNCYAERQAFRFSDPGAPYHGLVTPSGRWNGTVRLVKEHLEDPLRKKRPRRWFVNSMSDLFHENLDDVDIDRIYAVMSAANWHTFQVLTKRADRMRAYLTNPNTPFRIGDLVSQRLGVLAGPPIRWPLSNVWHGVSVESDYVADRIDQLVACPSAVRFISAEPLLGGLDLSPWLRRLDHCASCRAEVEPQVDDRCPACGVEGSLVSTWGDSQAQQFRSGERYENGGPTSDQDGPQIHWVIAGGESGPGARPAHPDWFRLLRDQCEHAGVAYFFKQWGEWVPCEIHDGLREPREPSRVAILDRDGRVRPYFNATTRTVELVGDGEVAIVRAGKKRAGRLLDGVIWGAFPSLGTGEEDGTDGPVDGGRSR